MATFSITRRATADDYVRLDRSAARFLKRHALPSLWDGAAYEAIPYALEDRPELARMWRRCVKRAIGVSHARAGIFGGYVGHWIE